MIAQRRSLILGAALMCCAVTAPAAVASNGGAGAVFTTDAQGLAVNQNLFDTPVDVHLNGGPPCNASGNAGLSDGWYVFRVTDPSGKVDMTAGEPLAERRFRVAAHAVVEAADPVDHPIKATACGAVLQVGPFATDSANGVYKLWVAPDDSATRKARRKDRGGVFNPCRSKTDNFRLRVPDPTDPGGSGQYLAPGTDPAPTTPPADPSPVTPPPSADGGPATKPAPGKKPCRHGGRTTDPAPTPTPTPTPTPIL